MQRFGLLVRCNPLMWDWDAEIPSDGSMVEVSWICRLKEGSVPLGTPLYVLGTHGIGIIAEGYTKSSIERKHGDEETWKEGHRDMSAIAPRIDITIRRNMASLSDLREANLDYLIGRQNTFSWLTESETFALENLLD